MRGWRDEASEIQGAAASNGRIRLLCPFDPVLRERARALRLLNFDYPLEVFTPAPKGKYGYYVLPMLQGDRIIGRVEPIVKRDRKELIINGVWWEPRVKPTKALRASLDEALERLARFVGATRVVAAS